MKLEAKIRRIPRHLKLPGGPVVVNELCSQSIIRDFFLNCILVARPVAIGCRAIFSFVAHWRPKMSRRQVLIYRP